MALETRLTKPQAELLDGDAFDTIAATPNIVDWFRGEERPGFRCSARNALAWQCRVLDLLDERDALRRLLANAYTGPMLYTDDGELQDSRQQPTIDFKRDTVDEIAAKMRQRGESAVQTRATA